MNRKRDISGIGELYLETLGPGTVKTNTDGAAFDNSAKSAMAKDRGAEKAQGDKPHKHVPSQGKGAHSHDNVVPMKADGVMFSPGDTPEFAKGTGPTNADNFKSDIADPKTSEKEDDLNLKNVSDPVKKTSNESINNSDMRDNNKQKSEFDRLYEFAMEAEDDLGGGLGGGLDGELPSDDEMPMDDEGLDVVTLELPREVAEQLHDVLMAAVGGGEDDGMPGEDEPQGQPGDLEAMEGEGRNPYGEKVVSEPEPKVLGGHGDRQHGDAGKGPWTKRGAGVYDGKGGSAETGSVDEDPEPKVLGGHGDRQHKDAGNTGSGSNKVKAGKKNNPGAHMLQ